MTPFRNFCPCDTLPSTSRVLASADCLRVPMNRAKGAGCAQLAGKSARVCRAGGYGDHYGRHPLGRRQWRRSLPASPPRVSKWRGRRGCHSDVRDPVDTIRFLGPLLFEYRAAAHGHGRRASRALALVTDPDVPIKLEIRDLEPGTRYVYSATSWTGDEETGTFVTPWPPETSHGLRFGVTGDARGDLAPYPALRNAPDRGLDFFVNLGDTIYADVPSAAFPESQARTLFEFRLKHDEVLSRRLRLNAFGRLRGSTSWFGMIDDHEVTDDFSGGASPLTDSRFLPSSSAYINETPLYQNGLRAFQEFNPFANEFYGETADPRTQHKRRLYRYRLFGRDAAILILDARSFRDAELPAVQNPTDAAQVGAFIAASFNPGRTLLGRAQLDAVKADLLDAEQKGVTWKFVLVPEPIQNLGVVAAPDRFEGYAAERTELLNFINQTGVKNVVFIAGDLHGTVVNNLTYQVAPFEPQIPVDAFEVIIGPAAYDAPLGPTIGIAAALGVVSPAQRALYDTAPRAVKDAFVEGLINQQLTAFGYDPIGLNTAELVQGSFVAGHVFGWTEFDIDAASQVLTVTTFGIEPYSAADLAVPMNVLNRQPQVVSQFRIAPR
jgi:alkaline phosphatase D